MTTTGLRGYLRANDEKLRLAGHALVMAVATLPLAGLVRRGWRSGPGNLTRRLVTTAAELGPGLATLQAGVLGLFLALLSLMLIDRKKRIQGVLLLVGGVVTGLALLSAGFVPELAIRADDRLWLVGAAYLGGVSVCSRGRVFGALSELRLPTDREFRIAPVVLFWASAAAVLALFLEAHLQYPPVGAAPSALSLASSVRVDPAGLAVHALSAGAFVYATRRFVGYDAEQRLLVLGPKNAGKSFFLYGAYTEWLGRKTSAADRGTMSKSTAFAELLEKRDEAPVESWFIENTGADVTREYRFTVERGDVFPENFSVEALDYPGESLGGLADLVADRAVRDDANRAVAQRLHERFRAADTLVCLIDTERFAAGDRLDVAEYSPIVRAAGDRDTDVVLVATKADVLDGEFEEATGHNPYDSGNLDRFAAYVTDRLSERESVKALLSETDAAVVHPVYFMTRRGPDGTRVPVESDGSMQPYGFLRLLEEVFR